MNFASFGRVLNELEIGHVMVLLVIVLPLISSKLAGGGFAGH